MPQHGTTQGDSLWGPRWPAAPGTPEHSSHPFAVVPQLPGQPSPALTQLQPLCALCSRHSLALVPFTTPSLTCPTSCTLSLLQPPSIPFQNIREHPSSVLTREHPTLHPLQLHPTLSASPHPQPLGAPWAEGPPSAWGHVGTTGTHRDHGDTQGPQGHTETTGTHPVTALGSAPGFGCRVKQPAGLGPTPGNSTAAESPAERAEQCWEYQSGRLGAGGCTHSQGFHPPGSTAQPAEPARGSAPFWEGSASLCTGASTVRRDRGKPG